MNSNRARSYDTNEPESIPEAFTALIGALVCTGVIALLLIIGE